MITPNFNMLLWFIFIVSLINSVALIVAGCVGAERPHRYGIGEALIGGFQLAVLIYIWVSS